MKIFISAVFLFTAQFLFSQNIKKICPPNWWTGMKDSSLQLLIYGEKISDYALSIKYGGVTIKKISKVENPNYLFVDLIISKNTQPGIFTIEYKKEKEKFSFPFELKKRTGEYLNKKPLTQADLIYLIMPDRFANGNKNNDSVTAMREKNINRDSMYARHGGDLQGIIDRLDYLKNLGITAIWSTPLIENDMPRTSYHGYAATDNYTIDPRFGDNELFVKYVNACHQKNIKVIMDVVHNHIGDKHWLYLDPPSKDWIHQYPEFTRTNYRTPALMDPYASNYDKNLMTDGWFDKTMPDLNQKNPFVAKYLIQNNIWWIEYANIDAFRLDTYPFSDAEFLQQWAKAIYNEYPGFSIFGETSVQGFLFQAFFANNNLQTNFKSGFDGVTDYQLNYAVIDALTNKFGWITGVSNIYLTLSQDFIYSDATKNVIFLDNHDMDRFYSAVGEDFNKYKMGIAFIMTMRGIPALYYGTEILMKNFSRPDGLVREDFAGGWSEDKINKFDENNLSGKEKEVFNYVKKLANWRKNSKAITQGKLMQFVPYDGVYVYFRYTNSECVMIVMNTNTKEIILETKNTPAGRYAERLNGFTKAKNVVSEDVIADLGNIKIPPMSTEIFEMEK